MRTWLVLACVGLTAPLLPSCASHRSIGSNDFSPAGLTTRIQDRDARIATLAGNGSLSYETPEAGGSAYFTMNLRKPDSLLVQFEGPFGIGGGFLFACKEKFVMYNGLENRVTTGVPDLRTIRGILPVELSLSQILEAFSGSFPLPPGPPKSAVAEGDAVRFDYETPSVRESYWVDPENGIVIRYRRSNMRGETLIDGQATRIREEHGVPFPHVIALSFPPGSQSVTLYYNRVDVNADDLSFFYAVPSSARTTIR
jgi:hypothetical protein